MPYPDRRATLITLGVSALAPAWPLVAWAADTYPSRPVRLVVPFPPAGSTDILARLVAQKMGEAFGQPFVVDNRAGAGGVIGSENIARSPADGYHLLMASSGPIAITPSLQPRLGYDPVRDFSPVSLLATIPVMLVVNAQLPARNVAELIALAKARPGKLNFASTGVGATPHLAGELFKASAGVDIGHIPYKGSAPALTDLMGGQVDLMFEQIPAALPHVRAGKLRALAVGSAHRVAALAELPTVAESGLPGFDVSSWFGIMAPAGTPPAVVAMLQAELARVMRQPDVIDKLVALGAEASGSSSQSFAQTIAVELPKWADVIRRSGASIN